MNIKPSKPFSSGTEFEIFLENFCYRCKKHKVREDGFCAYVDQGGCNIENAMEDARFDISLFPRNDIVMLEENGEVLRWNICTKFESDDFDLMEKYRSLFQLVRCKDCKHITPIEGGLALCTLYNIACAYNDFCSYGERKEGADND